MPEVTATEASRRFADLLDGVEHRGERYTIIRRGHVVAELAPAHTGSGSDAKALLRAFLDDLIESLPVLAYDLEVARSHTQLLVAARASGRPRGAHDLIIAATARATRRTVVTTDETGFDDFPGVPVRKPGS